MRNGTLYNMKTQSAQAPAIVAYARLGDAFMAFAFISAAIMTGSLTMLGEALRGVLLLLLQVFGTWLMFSWHKGRLSRFEYGLHRLENLFWVMLGAGFLAAAYWVSKKAVGVVSAQAMFPAPYQMAIAAVVNAIGVIVYFFGWQGTKAAATSAPSVFLRKQVSTRLHMLWTSVAMQITLTCAVLSIDPVIAMSFDVAGAIGLVLISILQGIYLLRHGLHVLLDAPSNDDISGAVLDAVSKRICADRVANIRTRGGRDHVEAHVCCTLDAVGSAEELAKIANEVEHELRAEGLHIDLRMDVVREQTIPTDPLLSY
jgi:divalent metal cation (Fe/Co/Zn/Cd) transporter